MTCAAGRSCSRHKATNLSRSSRSMRMRNPESFFMGEVYPNDTPFYRRIFGIRMYSSWGFQGSAKAPLNGGQTVRRLDMVRCRWRCHSPSPARGFQGAAMRPLVWSSGETLTRIQSAKGWPQWNCLGGVGGAQNAPLTGGCRGPIP